VVVHLSVLIIALRVLLQAYKGNTNIQYGCETSDQLVPAIHKTKANMRSRFKGGHNLVTVQNYHKCNVIQCTLTISQLKKTRVYDCRLVNLGVELGIRIAWVWAPDMP